MVGRRNSLSVTKRSLRNAESVVDRRPRRVVQSKLVDDTVGLSRQEEQELNKALYASLQENRRNRLFLGNDSSSNSTSSNGANTSKASSISHKSSSSRTSSNLRSDRSFLGQRRSLRTGTLSPKHNLRQTSMSAPRLKKSAISGSLKRKSSSDVSSNINLDESSQDSVRSSTSSANGSKRKIHAQRKFAQGCSLPGTPSCTPVKSSTPPTKVMSFRIPKTEDFLTFLCLRGSSILPPHLDFFNYSREEMAASEAGSRTASAGKSKSQRESTPDSTSTSSGANEEVAEAASMATPSPTGRGSTSLLAKRSAARASAGTPETARGIVSLRQGLQRKVSTSSSSSSSARFPVSSPSRSFNISRLTNSTPPYRNKFYFTPEKSPSPSKASGIRRGEFTPPSLFTSLHSDSSCFCKSHTFSPLVCSSSSKLSTPSPRSGLLTSRGSTSSSSTSLSSSSGASKRKHEAPDDCVAGKKRAAGGAFTPVAPSPGQVRGSAGRLTGTKRAGRSVLDASNARSARKNLLDKLSSVEKQDPNKVNHNKKWKDGARRNGIRLKESKVERKGGRLSAARQARNKLVKRVDKETKAKRRISLRLRKITRSFNGRVHKSDSDEDSVEEREDKQGSESDKDWVEAGRKAGGLKARKPYKIRPLERVRTRGYSLLLASKLALRRAKREQAAVKGKAPPAPQRSSKREDEVARSASRRDSPEGVRRSSSDGVRRFSNDGHTSQEPKKTKRRKSTDSLTQQRDSNPTTPKKTPPKKAKLSSSSSSPPLPAHEENSIPTFQPTESEFTDPLTYITKIQHLAEPYGMCRIIPPASWKLDSNKISDDVRFTPQVQQIHRLYKRWGPNVQHAAAINQHLLSENSNISTTPQIGGVQIDLPQLYHLVEESGGPKKMSDKKHWARVADIMNIPKQAMDRTVRLYDIYCHHVFPYATLSEQEKEQLEEEVKAIYELQTVEDDAITKGKSMPVSWFNRIARNVQSMWFKDEPSPAQVESQYWQIIDERTKHVAVQCGHINTRAQASAFPTRKDSAYSRHPWNLNNIPENESCLLKYLGPVAGITIPTLHMGMLFSTSCWSTDPHSLPYIQYLHSGADIIWYCIPKSQRSKFRTAMLELTPSLLNNKPRWLKEDCVMVNPALLKEQGVKVGRCLHSPRQFVVVFPGAYTATISCGYNVSESVHFVASTKWLPTGMEASLALTKSGERELFSMCSLLCGLTQDSKVDAPTLTEALPLFSSLVYKELDMRTQLYAAGLRTEKRSVFNEYTPPGPSTSKKRLAVLENEKVCELCDRICYLSMVLNEQDEQVLCLEHGLKHVQKKKNLKTTRLFLRYNQTELESMLKNAKDRLTLLTSKTEQAISSTGSKIKTNTKQTTQ
ncbi:protein Jumonji-like [Physella acuta]|uniref:protein Jumonji-like n=1 Tax=Physella acuta TaxID=109671 RepID=UPI0027DBC3C0|nr:protein Jumonji-like [Physella acuta]